MLRNTVLTVFAMVLLYGIGDAKCETHANRQPVIDETVRQAADQGRSIRAIIGLKEVSQSVVDLKYTTARDARRRISRAAVKELQRGVLSDLGNRLAPKEAKLHHSLENLPILTAEISPAAFELLQSHPNVSGITADEEVHALLADSFPLVNGPVAHNAGYTGQGVSVAVIDTGIDTDHPYLAGSIVWEECFLSDGGCPLSDGSRSSGPGSAEDDNDHGTHVSGIIASSSQTLQGIAPDAGIVSLKVLNEYGSGYTSDIMAAIDWVVSNKDVYAIRVINMSLGGGLILYSGACDIHNPQFAQVTAAAKDAGIAIFAASGNSGLDNALSVPACLSAVTSVGAVYDGTVGPKKWSICEDLSTQSDQVACFSNTDTILDLLAPGSTITSTVSGGGFDTFSGTSMACPHAAAAASLVFEKHPEYTPDEVADLLRSTGIEVIDERNGLAFPRIDLKAALNIKELNVDLPDQAWEGDGLLSLVGSIGISEPLAEDLAIEIVSLDTTEVTIPLPTATIIQGETSTAFSITIEDDDILDGTRSVEIKVIANSDAEYSGVAWVDVHDDETATLTVELPQTAREGDGLLANQGLLTVDAPVDEDVTVLLESSNAGKLLVPESIILSVGTASATFDITIPENVDIQPAANISVTATVTGWTPGTDTITIEDNDPLYYVNDNTTTHDIWCTAIGNDANDGLTPETPKASVQAILDSYDLEPGNVVAIDTGMYLLTDNIVVTSADQGDSNAPVSFVASPNGVVFDRQGTQDYEDVWHLSYADYIHLKTASGYQTEGVPQAWMKLVHGDRGLFLQGADHCRIERVEISDSIRYGMYALGSHSLDFTNNIVVNNGDKGLYASGSDEGRYVNNTIAGNGTNWQIHLFESANTVLRNNIIRAGGEGALAFSTYGDTPLQASDYNLFHLTDNAGLGKLDGVTYPNLLAWQTATALDPHSFSAAPQFVDSDNHDWHVQSTGGSYHEGAWLSDAAHSPAIDAGDPADALPVEPSPNGSRINIGAYGGTEQASLTPSGSLLNLKKPNGLEVVKGVFTITWLTVGDGWLPDDTLKIEYSNDIGQTWQTIADSVSVNDTQGDMGYEWDSTTAPDGPYFIIRITSNRTTEASDQSEFWFSVHNGPVHYFVNDGSPVNDVWCTAPGEAANKGTSPDVPMDSVQQVLSAFDLEPGDTVFIDTGTYPIQENITITTVDQGSPDAPVSFVASPNGVVFDRQGTQDYEDVWHLSYADYIHLKTASGYQTEGVPQAWMKLVHGDRGLFLQGADHCRIERVEISDSIRYGMYTLGSHSLDFTNNIVVNNGDMGLYALDSDEGRYVNNTIAGNGGNRQLFLYQSTDTVLRNNIIQADGDGAQAFFIYGDTPLQASDYNLFHLTDNAGLGTLDEVTYPNLLAWQTATALDPHSFSAAPQFVDSDNHDWHVQSTGGSYHEGAWLSDAAHSPAIDAGDPADALSAEPSPNGSRINIGAYGGTAQASKSGDTDNDGILDGIEDANHNGVVDDGETDPYLIDTDGDGIQDGTEIGLTLADIGADTDTGIFIPDADPNTTTDPLDNDSDNDGLIDGEEDLNHNGAVEEGETDPNRKPVEALPFIPLLLLEDS